MNRTYFLLWFALISIILLPTAAGRILLDVAGGLIFVLFAIPILLTGVGWIGWRFWPQIDAFPKRYYSLYFLFAALFYFYYDISYASTIKQIRNDQEIFEVLMSVGLLAHCWNSAFPNKARNILRNDNKI